MFDPLPAPETSGRVTAEPARASSAPVPAPEEPTREEIVLGTALRIFNAGEYPRRVAGVARSLGEPVISVRAAEHHEDVIRIVVAWELCWYRYEVDIGEGSSASAVAAGQGTELSELARVECEGNAIADSSGAITLAQ